MQNLLIRYLILEVSLVATEPCPLQLLKILKDGNYSALTRLRTILK